MARVSRIAVSGFVLLCTVQALYWPLLMKPGTELDWWQVHWLAQTGYVLGLPVMVLAVLLGGKVQLLIAVLWSACVYWLLGIGCRLAQRLWPGA